MSFQTPQFFAWDNLGDYLNGEISSLNKSVAWALPGGFSVFTFSMGQDGFEEYNNGTLDSPNLGKFWTEDGSTIVVT